METPKQRYTADLKAKFDYRAAWLPSAKLHLGDIGILEEGVFKHRSTLAEQLISFSERVDNELDSMEFNSNGGVSIGTKLAGQAAPVGSALTSADAGFVIEFSQKNAILFQAQKCKRTIISNMNELAEEILARFSEGVWQKEWVIITELIQVESATILISDEDAGKIELKATANIGLPQLKLADANFGFTPAFTKGISTKFIATQGLTPLYNVAGVAKKYWDWFGKPIFVEKSVDDEAVSPFADVLERVED